MDELKLLPCPFCGGEAFLYADDGIRVICSKCRAQSKTCYDIMQSSKSINATKSVIEKWNRRAEHETD